MDLILLTLISAALFYFLWLYRIHQLERADRNVIINIKKLVEYENKWLTKKPDYKPKSNTDEYNYWEFYKRAPIEARKRK